jgi:uncharacterized protein (DUF1778 family)/predicted GNAT family N-acyltransferase
MSQAMRANSKTERLEARVSSDQKNLFKRAAELHGTSLSDFVVIKMQEAATETITRFDTLRLRDQDREVFVNALLNPPKPTEFGKAAAARYKERMGLWLDEPVAKPEFVFEPLGDSHDRAAFSCGDENLASYLKTRARQDVAKNLAAVFIMTQDSKTILGFYTLSQYSIDLGQIPPALSQKLTKHHQVPATLLGRLGRSIDHAKKGFGETLVMDALRRSFVNAQQVGSWAVVVDAKHEKSAAFFKQFGFTEFPLTPLRLFMTMKMI